MQIPPPYECWPSRVHLEFSTLRSTRLIRTGDTILTASGVAPQGIPLAAASSLVLNAQWLSDSVGKLDRQVRRAVLALRNTFATPEENAWADGDKLGRRLLSRKGQSMTWLQGLFKSCGIEDRRPASERLWLFPEPALTINWNSTPPIGTLSALVDIPPDTVFTRPWARIELYAPFADRQRLISAVLGYSCVCSACSSPSAASDERRASLPKLMGACTAWLEGGKGDPVEICREGKRVLDEGGVMDQEGVQVGKTALALGLASVAASVRSTLLSSHFLLIADRGIDYAKTSDSARAGRIASLVKNPRSQVTWGKKGTMDLGAAWILKPTSPKSQPKPVLPASAPASTQGTPPALVAPPPPVEPAGPVPDQSKTRKTKKKKVKPKKKAVPKAVAVNEEPESASYELGESVADEDEPAPPAPTALRSVLEPGWTTVDHSLPKQVVQVEPRALEGDELYYLRDLPNAPLSPPTSTYSRSPPSAPTEQLYLSARFPTRPNPTAAAPLHFLSSTNAYPLTPPRPQVVLSDHGSINPAPSSRVRPPSPRAEIAASQLAKAVAEREQARMDEARPRLEEAAKNGGWGIKHVERERRIDSDQAVVANDQPPPPRAPGIVVKGGDWNLSVIKEANSPLATTPGATASSMKLDSAPPPAKLARFAKLDPALPALAQEVAPAPLIETKRSWRDRANAAPVRPKPAWAKPAIVASPAVVETSAPVLSPTTGIPTTSPVFKPAPGPPAPLLRSRAQSEPARSVVVPFATRDVPAPLPDSSPDVLYPSYQPSYLQPDSQPFPLGLTSSWDSPSPPLHSPAPPTRSPTVRSLAWELASIRSHSNAVNVESHCTDADGYGADVNSWRAAVAEAGKRPESPPKDFPRPRAMERGRRIDWAEEVEQEERERRVEHADGKLEPLAQASSSSSSSGGCKLPQRSSALPSLHSATLQPITLRGGWLAAPSSSYSPLAPPTLETHLSALAAPYSTNQQSTLLGLLQPRVTVQDTLKLSSRPTRSRSPMPGVRPRVPPGSEM